MIKMAGKYRKSFSINTLLRVATLAASLVAFSFAPASGAVSFASQGPQFFLDADNLNLSKGVSAGFVVSVLNARGAKIENIEGLEDFETLSQNQSTSTSIIQGVSSYREDIYYIVIPKSAGVFSIKANIEYKNNLYETNELTFTVSEGNAGNGEAARDLFVNTLASHTEAYLGEKIVITYELYSRYDIEDFNLQNYTSVDGAVVKEVPDDQLRAEYVYLDGVRFGRYEIKRIILDPIKSGALIIPSFRLQASVLTDRGTGSGRLPNVFGGSGSQFGLPGSVFGNQGSLFSMSETKYLQTDAQEILIKPLPSMGRPADFSVIVGQVLLDGRYSRTELNYGDSLVLSVNASGYCNLDGMKSLFPGGLPGFAVYETQKVAVESFEGNRYFVQKDFDVILVPDRTGVLDVTPGKVSFFNPESGAYETVEIPGAPINVIGETLNRVAAGSAAPDYGYNPGEGSLAAPAETLVISQVNYSAAGDGYLSFIIGKRLLSAALIALAVSAAAAVLAVWLIKRRKKRDPEMKSLYKRLKAAGEVNEIYGVFNDIIKRRYKISIKANSRSAVLSGLPDADFAARIAEVMDYMETPGDKNPSDLKTKIKNALMEYNSRHYYMI